MPEALMDDQRKLIHHRALDAREPLTREEQELLEGTCGLYPDGCLDQSQKLPQVGGRTLGLSRSSAA
jgi:hypothetical protein